LCLGWDYIWEIKIWIVFHRESTIDISLQPIHLVIQPKNSDIIHDNGKICAKKTRDLAKNTRDPIFLAQTFPAIQILLPSLPGRGEFPAGWEFKFG
jgi:hypothetical protein